MTFDQGLSPGQTLPNSELAARFRCSPQGGMRKSNALNLLVLTSALDGSTYHDRWVGDTFFYTGMGLHGDQSLSFAQNRTLADSTRTGMPVFLFEKLRADAYRFVGRVHLAGTPRPETQLDADGQERTVWVFPLELEGSAEPPPLPEEVVTQLREREERTARRLTDDDLARRAARGTRDPERRRTEAMSFYRDPYVAEFARRAAGGRCQLCGLPAPFQTKAGEPFLETHHIVWLAQGGSDTVENCVALCPNCHRKMHIRNEPADLRRLEGQAARGSDDSI